MADKELELRLKATGGKETAAEIEKVEEAIESTGKSADDLAREAAERLDKKFEDLSDGLDEVDDLLGKGKDKVDEVGDSMEKSGKKTGGFMGWLRGLGGQMLAAVGFADLLGTALGFIQDQIAAILAKQSQILRDAASGAPDIVRTTNDYADALSRVPPAGEAAAIALQQYFAAANAEAATAQQRAADAQALADARQAEADAVTQLQAARGLLTDEEANEQIRLRAIQSRIEEHERELAVLQQIATIEQAKADAAAAALAAAEQREQEAAGELEQFAGAGGDKNRGAALDPELQAQVSDLFLAVTAAERRLEQLNSLSGKDAAGREALKRLQGKSSAIQRLNPFAQGANLITSYLEVKDAIVQAEAEVELLTKEHKKASDELKGKLEKEGAALAAELEVARAEREARAKDAAEAGAGATSAADVAAQKAGLGGSILDAENRTSDINAEATKTRREREERERQERERQEAFNRRRNIDLAEGLAETAARGRESGGDDQVTAALEQLAAIFADGAVSPVEADRAARILSVVENLSGLTAAAAAKSQAVEKRLADLESRIRNNA